MRLGRRARRLAHIAPASSERGRRRQVCEAVTAVSEELSNTPAICAKSYVHKTVVAAFVNGRLEKFSETLKRRRSPAHREQLLAQVVARMAANSPHPGEGAANRRHRGSRACQL